MPRFRARIEIGEQSRLQTREYSMCYYIVLRYRVSAGRHFYVLDCHGRRRRLAKARGTDYLRNGCEFFEYVFPCSILFDTELKIFITLARQWNRNVFISALFEFIQKTQFHNNAFVKITNDIYTIYAGLAPQC